MPAVVLVAESLLKLPEPTATNVAKLVGLFTVLFAAILVGVTIVAYIKRRIQLANEHEEPSYTLAQLRELHEKGVITDYEHKRLKKVVAEKVRHKALGEETPDKAPPPDSDESGDR